MSESSPLPAEQIRAAMPPPVLRLYTPAFLLLCASHALFAGSFNMILPELPAYLTSLGGAEYKGLIIALFTLTAGLSRPFSGKLTDSIGRVPVMYVGVIACVVCGVLYPVLGTVGGFLLLRFLHGFSTGFKPTGSVAYAADIVPLARRGEAMGVLGIAMSIGGSAAPPLGSWLARAYSVDAMFYVSAGLAALSMLILYNLTETLATRERFRLGHLRVGRDDVFDPLALPAGVAMLLVYFSYGALLTLVPDLSDHLGVANRGLFFTIFTLASISTRLGAGKVSDTHGRVPVLIASTVLVAIAMTTFALARTPLVFYIASALYGLGAGIFSPAITAWTVDLGDPARRGRALATMYIALEIAIGGGALAAGWWFAEDFGRMPAVFFTGAGLSLLGCAYLVWWRTRRA